jgi:isopenicillin N synthase-like dioxygenase
MPEQIPVIDISPALDARAIGPVAAEIDWACREVGFLQIVGHGLDLALLDAVYTAAPDLWTLPPDVKATLAHPSGRMFYGVQTISDERGDLLRENWEINAFDSPDRAREAGVPERYLDHFSHNIWPVQVPALGRAAKACFDAERELGTRLMAIFAVALGLGEDYFADTCRNDSSYFAVNHYPGCSANGRDSVALYEHVDSGTLTLLHQRGDYAGLQVQLRDGDWTRVPMLDEALVINLGSLMARWTGGRWRATPHRVLLGERGQSRTSITTFHTPRIDALISPALSPVDGSEPLEPITVYDWEPIFLAKYARL